MLVRLHDVCQPQSLRRRHGLCALLATLTLAACSKTPESSPETSTPTAAASEASLVGTASIGNPSQFERAMEPVYISYYDLGLSGAEPLSAKSGDLWLPSQAVDTDGDGETDGLQLAITLPPETRLPVSILRGESPAELEKLTQAEISFKEGGEWVAHTKTEGFKEYVGGSFKNVDTLTPPAHYTDHSNWIRYEGPGIESDKVGYRVYLDWRNGFDIFGKNVSEPVLQQVGQDGYESYHHMQDWGMDILKVGSSLGAGGFGLWQNDTVELVSDVENWTATITDNGPIYSSFKIDYDGWQAGDKKVDLDAQFSMTAGSRLVHTRLSLSDSVGPMAIGVVKHKDTEFLVGNMDITGDAYTYIASWGKQSLNDDHLGMAVLFRVRDFRDIVDNEKSYVAAMNARGNELDYYFLAAWEGEHKSGISSKAEFVEYLEKEAERLTLATRVHLDTVRSEEAKLGELTAEKALSWSTRLADSELERKTLSYRYDGWDVSRKRKPKFEYDIVGWLPLTYKRLGDVTGETRYSDVINQVTATYINDDGSINMYKLSNYNIDAVAPGSAVLELYKTTGEEKYQKAAATLRHQLEDHPKTSEGAFWHKKKYEWQLWLDGVFMGMPFLAEYSQLFENGAAYEEVLKEYTLTRKYLRDDATGLYYHGWDEKKQQSWADSETGLSPEFWGRGVGWLAMALVDVLDYFPEEREDLRQPIIDMINELAVALIDVRDPTTGTWWQVLDKPGAPGNYRESSATAMFSYFFAKAVNHGYLDASYKDTAISVYDALINEFVLVHADGSISMTDQCYVAGLGFGRDGSYTYYMSEQISSNDPKGTFPFMLAGIEMYKLLKQ